MTPDELYKATGCTPERASTFAPHITEACSTYHINTPVRLAAFLAQIGHESGALRWVREIWGPSPAQSRYEGRKDLGNTEPGDGKRYMGRGLIQTTGRANYRALTQRLRARGVDCPDFEANPEELEQPRWAALSAGDYWDWRKLNVLADSGDFVQITRRINGGLNGQADRLARWDRAKKALDVTGAKEDYMPLPAFAAAALPLIVQAVPTLGKLFGSGSEVSERNIKAAETALQIVQAATNSANAQEAAEKVSRDPEAARQAKEAVELAWHELSEAGGGGIGGARAADAAFRASGDSVWRSPSFIIALMLLPMVYMVLVSTLFGVGPDWPSDVRAAIATAIVSGIIGAVSGYFFGQTTSRNRTPARE